MTVAKVFPSKGLFHAKVKSIPHKVNAAAAAAGLGVLPGPSNHLSSHWGSSLVLLSLLNRQQLFSSPPWEPRMIWLLEQPFIIYLNGFCTSFNFRKPSQSCYVVFSYSSNKYRIYGTYAFLFLNGRGPQFF